MFSKMWPQLPKPWYFNNPSGVAVNASGDVYVADFSNHRVQKFAADGSFISAWGSYGSGEAQLILPMGVAVDTALNVYVIDTNNHRIQKFAF